MTLQPFTLPDPDKEVGDPNPPGDVNNLINGEIAAGTYYNVMNADFGGGADPSGDTDSTTAIQDALNAASGGQIVVLPAGFYLYSAPLDIGTSGGLIGLTGNQSFGDPSADYGVGGLALQGAVLVASDTFADADASTGTIVITSPEAVQGGGQRLQNISLDLSNTPDGNNLHGILVQNNVACITLRDVTVYGGGDAQLGGDCLHCVASLYSPPDLLNVAFCHFVGGTGGVTLSGVADSYFTAVESTGNKNYAWNIINGNNSRWLGCKGETSTAGPGWKFTADSGFTGILHLALCTAQSNTQDGFYFTGLGTGTYQLIACSSDGDGTNTGSGGGGYAGIRLSSFAGIVLADGFNTRVNSATTSPQYGASMTNSNTLSISNANLAGETSPLFNGGTVTSFTGPTLPGGYLRSPSVYAPASLATFTTSSATYAAVASGTISTGAFTAPASGSVSVSASFVCSQATGNTVVGFGLAPHGSLSPIYQAWQPTIANTSVNGITAVPFTFGGLTPGGSYNMDLMYAANGDPLSVTAQSLTAGTLSASKAGPVIITVQAI